MGARVGLRPDKWDKNCNGSDEMTPAPVVLKLASVLTALFRFLALTSLGAFVITLVQTVDGKTSPFNCILFVQYFAESSVWYLMLSQAKAAIRVAFNDGTPFSATIPLRIKRMAILLIVLVILGMLFSLAASWLAYDAPPSIGGISMGYSGFPAPETWGPLPNTRALFPSVKPCPSLWARCYFQSSCCSYQLQWSMVVTCRKNTTRQSRTSLRINRDALPWRSSFILTTLPKEGATQCRKWLMPSAFLV